jgi:hypothetical protein
VRLALDLAGRVEESAVAEINRLRAVRADVHPGTNGSVRSAVGKSFVLVRPGRVERKPDRLAGLQLRRRAKPY